MRENLVIKGTGVSEFGIAGDAIMGFRAPQNVRSDTNCTGCRNYERGRRLYIDIPQQKDIVARWDFLGVPKFRNVTMDTRRAYIPRPCNIDA